MTPTNNNLTNSNLIRYYLFRKQMFQNHINQGHIGPILFPEIIKQLPIDEITGWGADQSNYKYFLGTLAFLGLNFENLTEEYRNPTNETLQGRMINAYKYILNDNDKFNALFDKFMEMKNAINQGRVNSPTNIYDEETDDDATVTDERTITEDDPFSEDESIDTTRYSIPRSLKSKIINKSSSKIEINDNDEGFDAIEGERKVLEYLDESPENIVFVLNTKTGDNKFFLTSKEQLQMIIENRTNIHYKCIKLGPQLLFIGSNDVIKNQPLLKMKSIGLPISYIYLNEIKTILETNKQIYVLSSEPIEEFKASASDDVLDNREGIEYGSAHCQYDEGYTPHYIYTISYLDLTDVKKNKRQRITGGKKMTRRNKKLYRKTVKYRKHRKSIKRSKNRKTRK